MSHPVKALLDAEGNVFRVFRDKRPMVESWLSGDQEHLVQAHVKTGGLVGLVPGSLGLLVVDVDTAKDSDTTPMADREAAGIDACGEPLARNGTPRGGVHLWYRAPEEGARNAKWKYGDIRCSAGYVVLWEPETAVRALSEAPAADRADLSKLPKKPPPQGSPDSENTPRGGWRSGPGQKASTPADLRATGEGNRNDCLNAGVYADARAGRLTPARIAEWTEAAHAAGLEDSEIDPTVASALSGGAAKPRAKPAPEPEQAEPPPADVVELDGISRRGLAQAFKHLGVSVRWNDRAARTELQNDSKPGVWSALTDRREDRLRERIRESCSTRNTRGEQRGAVFGSERWRVCLNALLASNEVDPVADWLNSLPPWDGIVRLDEILTELWGCTGALVWWAAQFLVLAPVQRTKRPGGGVARNPSTHRLPGVRQERAGPRPVSHP